MQFCPFVKDGYCLIKNIGIQMDRFKRKCITKLEKGARRMYSENTEAPSCSGTFAS